MLELARFFMSASLGWARAFSISACLSSGGAIAADRCFGFHRHDGDRKNCWRCAQDGLASNEPKLLTT